MGNWPARHDLVVDRAVKLNTNKQNNKEENWTQIHYATLKIRKIWTTKTNCCNCSKIWTMRFYHREMLRKKADRMANSVGPDQIAPVCPDLHVRKLRIIIVNKKHVTYLCTKTISTSTSSLSLCRKSFRKFDTVSYVMCPHTTICLKLREQLVPADYLRKCT